MPATCSEKSCDNNRVDRMSCLCGVFNWKQVKQDFCFYTTSHHHWNWGCTRNWETIQLNLILKPEFIPHTPVLTGWFLETSVGFVVRERLFFFFHDGAPKQSREDGFINVTDSMWPYSRFDWQQHKQDMHADNIFNNRHPTPPLFPVPPPPVCRLFSSTKQSQHETLQLWQCWENVYPPTRQKASYTWSQQLSQQRDWS